MMSSIYFRISLLGLFICVFITALFSLHFYHSAAQNSYETQNQKALLIKNEKKQDPINEQYREGVCKEFWIAQSKHTRLQYRIESELSKLVFVKTPEKTEITERLIGVKGAMQEKLFSLNGAPVQEIRFFQSDKASYNYKTHQLLAGASKLYLIQCEGNKLPRKPDLSQAFLKGTAKYVSFSITGKTPQFHAEEFKASLNNQGRGRP